VLRLVRIFLGSMAGTFLVASLTEIMFTGRLSPGLAHLFRPAGWRLWLAFLLGNLHSARAGAATCCRARAAELKNIAGRLEASLANAATINARLNQSEVRYKGLVDAQGRRHLPPRRFQLPDLWQWTPFSPCSAWIRMPRWGHPFTPELHPDDCVRPSDAMMFGSLPDSGASRMRYDQHVKTAEGFRWIAWEDFAVRDSQGRLVEVQKRGPRYHRPQDLGRRADRGARQGRRRQPRPNPASWPI